MDRKYFGTDGIRGVANRFPMTAQMAMRVAMAAAQIIRKNHPSRENRVVIGKDTRLSCYMLEQALGAGFLSMGMDVIFLGPIPTPAVAQMTRSLRADLGVMVSASHNPYHDNGIKLFGPDGYKLADEMELQIEALIESAQLEDALAAPDMVGHASRLEDTQGRYAEFIKSSLARNVSFEGLKIVVDCANGAGYKVAPSVLWEMGADIVSIGVKPNGKNINDKCGATHTELLQETVRQEKADFGIALDGDADRVILVDEKGNRLDGDQIMAAIATSMSEQGVLNGNCVVATVMSNLGLERYFYPRGIELVRTSVGDRYVVEAMRSRGANLGGEQSGHIILSDFATTGDGLLAGLQAASILKASGRPASETFKLFEPVPQILKNLRLAEGLSAANVLNNDKTSMAVKKAEHALARQGRLLVRASGTEPVIRVMAEGDDPQIIETIVNDLCDEIAKASAAS